MTVPTRREAANVLLALDPPAWFLRHACAVADVAGWLAARADTVGVDLDRRLVETAALLHDVDKLPGSGADGPLRHGEGSAAWLADHGYEELAPLVRDHPVTHLADDVLAARLAGAGLEAKLVAYADKRAGQRLESMDERFGSWRRRYPSGPAETPATGEAETHQAPPTRVAQPSGAVTKTVSGRPPTGTGWDDSIAALVARRARELELELCGRLAIEPDQVRRLRWSRRTLREAAASARLGEEVALAPREACR